MQAKGEHVEGMLVEDLLPGRQRGVDVAGDPVRKRGDVGLLAARGVRQQAARVLQRLAGGRDAGEVEGQHGEVALEQLPEAEIGIGGQQLAQAQRRIGAIGQIGQHRLIEGLGGFGRCGGHRQSVQVFRRHAFLRCVPET